MYTAQRSLSTSMAGSSGVKCGTGTRGSLLRCVIHCSNVGNSCMGGAVLLFCSSLRCVSVSSSAPPADA